MALTRTQIFVVGGGIAVLLVTGLLARFVVLHAGRPAATATSAGDGPAEVAAAAAVVYDPTKLLDNGVPAAEVYDQEPRSPAWADLVEATVASAIGRDFEATLPQARVAVKCKTLSCLVGVDAPADQRAAALAITKLLALAPWVVDLEPEEDGTMRWMFFTEPRFADPQAFVAWFGRIRKRRLAQIRAGEIPNPFPVPATQAPVE